MEITSQLVKTLREKTNAPMMNCKKALQECEGDIDKAVDWLRQKGLKLADVRSSRATREGLIMTAVSDDGARAAIVELNTETDFVAKMDEFKDMASALAGYLLATEDRPADVDALYERKCPKCGQIFKDVITAAIAKTGENMKLRRFAVVDAPKPGLLHVYVHPGSRLAVILSLSAQNGGPEVEELAHNLAMHVAWANPMALTVEGLPPALVEREKGVIAVKAEAEAEEKIQKAGPKAPPKEVLVAKMMEGQLRKFHGEVVLSEQAWIKDSAQTVGSVLKAAAKTLGPVEVVGYTRFQLGEELPGEA
jgi:elongation factor Ts